MSVLTSYRAPLRHGEALILPELQHAVAQILVNRRRQAGWNLQFCGVDWAQWRDRARSEMLRDAIHYTRRYRDYQPLVGPQAVGDTAIVMAGHQPTFFHPGVWFKNFAIDSIQRNICWASGVPQPAIAINLVIDNDVAAGASIRVPRWDPQTRRATLTTVAYDSAAGGEPFEQNRIRDRAIFDSFAERVGQAIMPLVSDPLVSRLWPHAVAAAQRCENVSCALAQARHALEGEQGLQTLELPLSVLCRSEAFAAFVLALTGQPQRLSQVYNDAVQEYRYLHGIRSSAHPVPSLGVDGPWYEVPLWIYADDAPGRRPAWVRDVGGCLEISNRQGLSIRLSKRADKPTAAAELAQLCGPQFKLRPRALLTTMYARLMLSDLFVHGIGGAKYDELGDQITRRFFGIQPPELMVVSATVLLSAAQGLLGEVPTVAQLRRRIRQTYYAPESFAGAAELPDELCRRKRELIANRPQAGSKKEWHDALTRVNEELSQRLEAVRQTLVQQMGEARQAEYSAALLASREHPFCLFPLEELLATFAGLLRR